MLQRSPEIQILFTGCKKMCFLVQTQQMSLYQFFSENSNCDAKTKLVLFCYHICQK